MTQTSASTPSKKTGNSQTYEASHTPLQTLENDADTESLRTQLANRYHVIKKLGKGSQGAVYLAESASTHKKVAIKQLHIQSVKDWKQYDLFQREADVLKRLDIPGVAKLHETIEMLDIQMPTALIVQDYIEGDPLQKFIALGHRFQIDQIGSILLQLLDVLQKLHASVPQVIHRDIKPSNILLNYTENGQIPEVHLIDFGAVSNPQVKGGGSTVVGTYGYMAPEQLMGRACEASDLYSLAIVAVYLLSGVPPEELEIQDYHVLIDSHLEHLPYSITAFLRKMLEPRADDRMTDYNQIRKFFSALKDQKFNEIPKVSDLITQNKYSSDKVYSYHQPGNIVLWQELEDATPRSIPKRYQKGYSKFKFHLTLSIIFNLINFLIIIALLIFMFSLGDVGIIFGIFCLPIFLLIPAFICAVSASRIICNYTPFYFLKYARKSLATVIRIEYISCYDAHNRALFIQSYIPTWRITYSFNPPDDSSPDNLIRTVETHVKPDIHEGDLIPILYLIHKGELAETVIDDFSKRPTLPILKKTDKTKEYVYSTPFPIPMSDELKPSNKC